MGYGTKDHIAGIMQYGICQWIVYPMVFVNGSYILWYLLIY
jgi:hypothetical protein